MLGVYIHFHALKSAVLHVLTDHSGKANHVFAGMRGYQGPSNAPPYPRLAYTTDADNAIGRHDRIRWAGFGLVLRPFHATLYRLVSLRRLRRQVADVLVRHRDKVDQRITCLSRGPSSVRPFPPPPPPVAGTDVPDATAASLVSL